MSEAAFSPASCNARSPRAGAAASGPKSSSGTRRAPRRARGPLAFHPAPARRSPIPIAKLSGQMWWMSHSERPKMPSRMPPPPARADAVPAATLPPHASPEEPVWTSCAMSCAHFPMKVVGVGTGKSGDFSRMGSRVSRVVAKRLEGAPIPQVKWQPDAPSAPGRKVSARAEKAFSPHGHSLAYAVPSQLPGLRGPISCGRRCSPHPGRWWDLRRPPIRSGCRKRDHR